MVGQKVGDPGGRELDRRVSRSQKRPTHWSNRVCWYLRMSVNRRNDLQIFDFFRLLTIFFCGFTGIVGVTKGLYR